MRTVHLCGEAVPHPGHVCAFFDSRQQKYDTLIPFLKDAISAGDEVINIVDESEKAAHLDTLLEGGVPIRAAMTDGHLNVFTSQQTYLQEGEDILPRLLAFLRETLERAKEEKHSLRTWGEMNWVGRGHLPIKDVLDYEARVNELLAGSECTLLCVYDLADTPSTLMTDILATHPFAILNGRLRKNPHFVKPAEFLQMLRARES